MLLSFEELDTYLDENQSKIYLKMKAKTYETFY